MNLYLHIGAEKTGSTALQQFLSANRELLRVQGILYPRSPGEVQHDSITAACGDWNLTGPQRIVRKIETASKHEEFRRTLKDRLTQEVQEACLPKVVISDELLSSRLTSCSAIERLYKFL